MMYSNYIIWCVNLFSMTSNKDRIWSENAEQASHKKIDIADENT